MVRGAGSHRRNFPLRNEFDPKSAPVSPIWVREPRAARKGRCGWNCGQRALPLGDTWMTGSRSGGPVRQPDGVSASFASKVAGLSGMCRDLGSEALIGHDFIARRSPRNSDTSPVCRDAYDEGRKGRERSGLRVAARRLPKSARCRKCNEERHLQLDAVGLSVEAAGIAPASLVSKVQRSAPLSLDATYGKAPKTKKPDWSVVRSD